MVTAHTKGLARNHIRGRKTNGWCGSVPLLLYIFLHPNILFALFYVLPRDSQPRFGVTLRALRPPSTYGTCFRVLLRKQMSTFSPSQTPLDCAYPLRSRRPRQSLSVGYKTHQYVCSIPRPSPYQSSVLTSRPPGRPVRNNTAQTSFAIPSRTTCDRS